MISRAKWPFGNGVQQHVDPAPDGKPAAIPSSIVSADTRQFGLENFGNTCYANSVMQALYFCTPFRSLLLQENDASIPSDHQIPPVVSLPAPIVPVRRKGSGSGPSSESFNHPNGTPPKAAVFSIPSNPPTMFSALRSLFLHISTNPMEKGTVSPRAFIDKLKEFNELFRSSQHQDAHEFLNYLLNKIVEEIEESRRPHEDLTNSFATLSSKAAPTVVTATTSSNSGTPPEDMTFIHKLFEGILTSETRCLTCETVSARDESFLDLSIDIEQNSSVTACLRQFSASEMLCQKNKFFCDSCGDLQEAEKRMKIKRLPNVLALHLKRFKVQEDVQKFIKLAYRVAFPLELRLFNTVDDMYDADKLFDLFAIVIHIGNGPHHGHYISIIKTVGGWQVFDDENVSTIVEGDIPKYFGESPSGSAYVLFYQAADMDYAALGMQTLSAVSQPQSHSNSCSHLPPASPELFPTPSLPPGLVDTPELPNEADESVFTASSIATPYLAPNDVKIPTPRDASGSPTALSTSTPVVSKGKGIFSSLRRNPSSNVAARPKSSSGLMPAADTRHSTSERSPQRSSEQQLPPPAESPTEDQAAVAGPSSPLLSPSVAPIPSSRAADKSRSDEVEAQQQQQPPERKSSVWFGKRRSFRVHDKEARPRTAYESSSSIHDDNVLAHVPSLPSNSTWFRPTSSNGRATNQRRRPSDVGDAHYVDAPPKVGKYSSNDRSGHDWSVSTSATSSMVSSAASQGRSAAGRSSGERTLPLKLSIPDVSPSSPPLHSPDRPRARTPDHKLSIPHLPTFSKHSHAHTAPPVAVARRPSTADGGTFSQHHHPFFGRPLPPVPPLPPGVRKESDGTVDTPTAQHTPTAEQPSREEAGLSSNSASAAVKLKRATRKLSLSGPILGFGRSKHKPENADRPPSSYNGSRG